MEEPLGVHVFPNRLSAKIRQDPNLIHYEGHAPIYGDRMLKGEAPVPDFQGNRPADFFRNQARGSMREESVEAPDSETTTEESRSRKGSLRGSYELAGDGEGQGRLSSLPSVAEAETHQPEDDGEAEPEEEEVEEDESVALVSLASELASKGLEAGPPRPDAATPPSSPDRHSRRGSKDEALSFVRQEFAFLQPQQQQSRLTVTLVSNGTSAAAGHSPPISDSPSPPQQSPALPVDSHSARILTVETAAEKEREKEKEKETADARPPYINDSLLAELKQIDASDPQALTASLHRLKDAERREMAEREAATEAEIERIRREWTLETFLPLVPKISDKSGQPVPEWKRSMAAVKRQEEALRAEEARLRTELDEYKRSKGPNWKRSSTLSTNSNN